MHPPFRIAQSFVQHTSPKPTTRSCPPNGICRFPNHITKGIIANQIKLCEISIRCRKCCCSTTDSVGFRLNNLRKMTDLNGSGIYKDN